ncbi:hypothetical protein L1049_013164 [Liquidambar formosana]|uniref:Uncharacterized protein n=1 Tax=Liquidambar formosana TaxID=63359 RepID=A0AAP0RNP3_LIQFO
MEGSISSDRGAQVSDSGSKRGGSVTGLTLASGGLVANLIVYLIGEFHVKSIDAAQISNVGMVLLTLTAMLNPLRPQPCENGSSLCRIPSKLQFAVLYTSTALTAIGLGGTRFTIATVGADQLDEPKDQGIFFNWYFFTLYTSSVISATAIIYIEDNVSWAWGFGLCVVATIIGLAIFLLGKRFYRHVKPQGSPFRV